MMRLCPQSHSFDNKSRLVPYFSLLLAVFFMLLLSFRVNSEPELTRPLLKMGTSPRLKSYSPATFSCLLNNPDAVPHNMSLRILPKDLSFNSAAQNVYTESVWLPAKSSYYYTSTIILDNSETYLVSAFSDGVKLSKIEEDVLVRQASPKSQALGVLNDSSDIGLGSFVNHPDIQEKYNLCYFASSSLPASSVAFDRFAAVIVLAPDFDSISSMQYRAIIEYVLSGGTIVFGDPHSVMLAANTPLKDLLPAIPSKIRQIEALPSLSPLIPGFKGVKRLPMLESFPSPRSSVFLEEFGLPLVVWGKFGLGSSRLIAVPIGEHSFNSKDDWIKIFKLMLSNQDLLNENKQFSYCLDEMTGFSVPPTSKVMKLLLFYLAASAVFLLAGHVLKRQAIAWIACVAFSLAFSVFVMNMAASAAKEKGGIVSGIELVTHGDHFAFATSFYGLFSSKSETLSARSSGTEALISTIASNESNALPFQLTGGDQKGSIFKGRDDEKPQSSDNDTKAMQLMIERENGVSALQNMALQSLRGRQFKVSKSGFPPPSFDSVAPSPHLVYAKDGIRMDSWTIPSGISCDSAFVAFPDGALPLVVEGRTVKLSGEKKAGIFSTDTIGKSIVEAFRYGARPSSPALVLVEKLESTSISLSSSFKCQGRRLHIFPADEEVLDSEFVIPPEDIVFSAGDSSSRTFINGNRLVQGELPIFNASEINLEFKIPQLFKLMEVVEIKVVFDYDNPGANISASPVLLANSGQGAGNSKDSGKKKSSPAQNFQQLASMPRIKAVSVSGGDEYLFNGPEISNAIDPLTGSGRLMISADEKNSMLDPVQKRRANAWSINRLLLSVKVRKK